MKRAPALIVFFLLLLAGAHAWADGRVVYRLAVEPPKTTPSSDRVSDKIAEIVAERLSRRMKAAGVKEFEVRGASSRTVLFETGWDHPRPWMVALLTAPGHLEVRPVVEEPDWMPFARTLPEGVVLRGDPVHLWSARRKPLETWLERVALAGRVVELTLDDNGFRTITLGESVGGAADVGSVSSEQSSTGTPFVAISFRNAVAARLAESGVSGVQKVAIVLDGEVIGFVPAEAFTAQQRVRIGVPSGAVGPDREARELWVRQVAGRLAAPLPIPIAILKE